MIEPKLKDFLVLFKVPQRDLKKWTHPSYQKQMVADWMQCHKGVLRSGRAFKQELLFVDRRQRTIKGKPSIQEPVIAGFFLIKAENLNQAASIGETCPVLKNESEIEIREILR